MKTKKITIILVSIFLFISFGKIFPESSGQKSFLWEVQGKIKKSFLLGSIHMLKKEMYPLAPAIEESFEKADILVLEVDLSGNNMMELSLKLMEQGRYQDKETLKTHISAKTFQIVQDTLKKKYDQDIKVYMKYKPWFLAMWIETIELTKMGFNPQYGIDYYFLNKAKGKKEINGLETADYQIKLFEKFSKNEQEKFLLYTLSELEQSKKYIKNLVKSWQQGDPDMMEKLLNKNYQQTPEFEKLNKILLDDRNLGMAEGIDRFLNTDKTYFIVVGAAHLIGPKGIIKLLENKGYSFRQL